MLGEVVLLPEGAAGAPVCARVQGIHAHVGSEVSKDSRDFSGSCRQGPGDGWHRRRTLAPPPPGEDVAILSGTKQRGAPGVRLHTLARHLSRGPSPLLPEKGRGVVLFLSFQPAIPFF